MTLHRPASTTRSVRTGRRYPSYFTSADVEAGSLVELAAALT